MNIGKIIGNEDVTLGLETLNELGITLDMETTMDVACLQQDHIGLESLVTNLEVIVDNTIMTKNKEQDVAMVTASLESLNSQFGMFNLALPKWGECDKDITIGLEARGNMFDQIITSIQVLITKMIETIKRVLSKVFKLLVLKFGKVEDTIKELEKVNQNTELMFTKEEKTKMGEIFEHPNKRSLFITGKLHNNPITAQKLLSFNKELPYYLDKTDLKDVKIVMDKNLTLVEGTHPFPNSKDYLEGTIPNLVSAIFTIYYIRKDGKNFFEQDDIKQISNYIPEAVETSTNLGDHVEQLKKFKDSIKAFDVRQNSLKLSLGSLDKLIKDIKGEINKDGVSEEDLVKYKQSLFTAKRFSILLNKTTSISLSNINSYLVMVTRMANLLKAKVVK